QNPVPTWIIDVASPTDRFYLMEDKVTEYFQSGVQVAWEVFPPFERVRIFRPVQETLEMTGEDVCDAEPALNEFDISVADLFRSR
ncbi:MAG: Uma2 family endonuclease, partial [Verrucomicrobiota bacterium]